MFYRFAHIHFNDGRYGDLLDSTEMTRDDVEAIEGFEFAEICRPGPSEGVIIAAYKSEDDFARATEVVAGVMGAMAKYLTSEPHTHAGTSDRTFRRA